MTLVFVAATTEQQKEKEVEMEAEKELEDLEVAQALIAEPAFKLDSSSSPYKVSVAIFCFSRSCGDANSVYAHAAE